MNDVLDLRMLQKLLVATQDAMDLGDVGMARNIVSTLIGNVSAMALADDRKQVVTLDLVPTGPAWEEDIIMPTQERDEF